ncbi:hypothetical protein L1281_002090 [Neisseria sp. HSC-16F19]|nr:DUF1097 domain-containing protein [Neisseria sp. HSC-16F19]MCP2041490.1 hypothetical protein [Neisseria sp. HSC-16F19]
MKFLNHFWIALFVGVQACVIQVINQGISPVLPPAGNLGFAWVSFLAWATYFMVGCTVADGIRAWVAFIIGIVASIAIMEMAGAWAALGFWAAPLAILIIATVLFLLELAPKLFNLIPAIYVSAAAFFACMSYVPGASYGNIFLTEMVYLTLGLLFGWMTIAFRGWYERAQPRL